MDAIQAARQRRDLLRASYQAEGRMRDLLAVREAELRVREADAVTSRRNLLAFHGRGIEATISAESRLREIALAEGPIAPAPRRASPAEIALVLARQECRAEEQKAALAWFVSGAGDKKRFRELQRRLKAAEALVPSYLLIPTDVPVKWRHVGWTGAVVVGPDLDDWQPSYPECVAETGQLVAAVSQDFSRRVLTMEQQERLASLMASPDTRRA